MKKYLFVFIACFIFLRIFIGVFCDCGSCGRSMGGDGKSACKNCGRSPVYALGFCKSCYKSFIKYTYD